MAVVYVSSTYQDLRQEREAAYHAMRRLRLDVLAMEDYVAADTRPLDKCLGDVARSDIYVGIFGWRYGYVPTGQERSITELEYREAAKHGRKCLIFLQADVQAPAPADPIDRGRIEALRAELTRDKLASFFSSPDDLAAKVTAAVAILDVASANSGIRLLKNLITRMPAVADAVSRSKEVIEHTYRQICKLELFKKIHDALHSIEFECLRPMEASGIGSRLRPFKIEFDKQARRIRESIHGREMNPALHDDIVEQLDAVSDAFRVWSDNADDAAAYRRVVGELAVLLSGLPTRLDSGIADAAAELNLDRLVQMLTMVSEKFGESASEHDSELATFVRGIDALRRLRDELKRRVEEHTQLQRLDSKLRTVCIGETALPAISAEWERAKRVRARLTPPFSPQLGAANADLVAIESEIEEAVGRGEQQKVLALVQEYFRSVSTVFRDVDTNLKEFCMRLSDVNQPLKTVLDMC
jgi:Domain of unknown function (DUF4062)